MCVGASAPSERFLGPGVTASGLINLPEYARAQRERDTLVRLLRPYRWFIEARVEVKPTGQVFLIAITDPPSDPTARAAIMERVASHLGGVLVEDRPPEPRREAPQPVPGSGDTK